MSADKKLEQFLADNKLVFPAPGTPKGAYQTVVIADGWAYLAGHLPIANGQLITGCLGKGELQADIQAGYNAAQWAGLNILATLKQALGSLDKVDAIVKVVGFVQCTDSFHSQANVLNGTSELFMAVFGAGAGQAARSALGTNALPLDSMVEVEAIVKLKPQPESTRYTSSR